MFSRLITRPVIRSPTLLQLGRSRTRGFSWFSPQEDKLVQRDNPVKKDNPIQKDNPVKKDNPIQKKKIAVKQSHSIDNLKIHAINIDQDQDMKQTAGEVVAQDLGLNLFLKKVYLTTGVGITATMGSAWGMTFLMGGNGVEEVFLPMLGGGFVTAIIGIFGLDYWKPVYNEEKTEGENPPARLISYGALITGMSLCIAPSFVIFNSIDTMILPTATILSVVTMGGASMYAYSRPPGELMSWDAPLMGGLVGLVGLGLTSMGSLWIFGPNWFATTFHTIDIYGGIVLFTGLTAYETQLAIEMYRKGEPDHLGVATNFYLDFLNLLLRIAEAIAKSKQR